MSEIFKSRPKLKMGLPYYPYSKISIFFVILLIINYPVSYNVDKAYKEILGLIFESAWTKTLFDRMRKTDVTCKVLACFAWNGTFA